MNRILQKILVLSLIFCCFKLRAQVETNGNFTEVPVQVGTSVTATDEKYADPAIRANLASTVFTNAITLRLQDNKVIPSDFSCTLKVKIEYWSSPSQPADQPTEINDKVLSINYVKAGGSEYRKSDTYSFQGAYKVRVTVTELSTTPNLGSQVACIQLSNDITSQRKYAFTKALPVRVVAADFLSIPSQANGQLKLTWDHVAGAEEYDLEWATVDKGSELESTVLQMLGNTYSGGIQPEKIFVNNATRITTSENSYKLSLMYNADYLVARIRQVHYTSDGIRREGDWTYEYKNNNNTYVYAAWNISTLWHSPDMNWQYSASFAEEGKKKEVVNYFDGTLRGRQTVTVNNSDNVAVVQENVYDEMGRVSASILPAPVKGDSVVNEQLHYFKSFNQNLDGRPYNLANLKQLCEISPDPLNNISGASKYYSLNNQFRNDANYLSKHLYTQYIPDATNYPLSVTQYTPDNTGRIKTQGGVGSAFQPGLSGLGKVTQYFYAKPEQWELDRLFGNDVGYAEHYTKNMVIDPNGQISISYLNASGKTIATALTGSGTSNLENLPSNKSAERQSIRILNPAQFRFNSTELKLIGTTTYLASLIDESASFSYDVEKLIHNYPETGTNKVSSNCNYDLTIKIKNYCNEDVPISDLPMPVQLGPDKPSTGSFNINISKIGEYYFTFELALKRQEIEDNTERYITEGQSKGIVKKEFDFIKTYLEQLDLSSCFGDCSTCIELLGTESGFTAMIKEKLTELEVDPNALEQQDYKDLVKSKYTTLKGECQLAQSDCPAESPCSKFEKLMLEDIRPRGQYAVFDANNLPLETDMNVLYKYWRTVFPIKDAASADYQSDLIELDETTSTSPYDKDFTLDMLVAYWKEDWGLKFLPYHPEYCKLQFCYNNSGLVKWDNAVEDRIVRVSDFSYIKVPEGATTPAFQYNNSWLLNIDPFFMAGAPGANFKPAMLQDLDNYTTNILNFSAEATVQTKGLSKFVDYLLYCADKSDMPHPVTADNNWNACSLSESDPCRVPNREWQMYKDIYLEVKAKYFKQARDLFCGNICDVGTPHTFGGPSSLSVKDFIINEYNGTATCSTGFKNVKVSYVGSTGATPVSAAVQVYYPDQSNPINIVFNAGDREKLICIPDNIPVGSMKIFSVSNYVP